MAAVIRGVYSIDSYLTQRRARASSAEKSVPKNISTNIYALNDGVLCTRRSLTPGSIVRRSVTVVLTVTGAPFQLTEDTSSKFFHAAAVRPLVRHSLCAENVGAVSLIVDPNHRHYRAFRAITNPGVLSLERELFRPYDAAMRAASRGALDLDEGNRLFNQIIDVVANYLPEPKPTDDRVAAVLALLEADPLRELHGLAEEVGLSHYRLSHLFADEIGISLKGYQLWWRIVNAGRLLDLGHTIKQAALESGFGDVEHLCRSWRQTYGAPPSYFFHNSRIRFFSAWNPARQPISPGRSGSRKTNSA